MDSARDGPPRPDGRPPKRLTGRLRSFGLPCARSLEPFRRLCDSCHRRAYPTPTLRATVDGAVPSASSASTAATLSRPRRVTPVPISSSAAAVQSATGASSACSSAPLRTDAPLRTGCRRRGAPESASSASVDTAMLKSIDNGHTPRHPSAVAGPVGRQGVERIEGQYKGAPRQRSRHRQRTPVRCAHRARTYQQRNPVR
jgi:hypothetical protein